MSSMTLSTLFLVLSTVANVAIGIVVFRQNPRRKINATYAALAAVMSVWLVVNYLSYLPAYLGLSLYLIRWSVFWATPMNALLLSLVLQLPPKMGRERSWVWWVYGGAMLLIMGLTLSPYAFASVAIVNGMPQPQPGLGILPFGIFSVGTNALTVAYLVRKLYRAEGSVHMQVRIVLWGVIVMLGFIVATIFLPVVLWGVNQFVPLLPLYSLFFLGMTAYATVYYGLFDVRVMATKAFTIVLWIILGSKLFVSPSATAFVIDVLIFLSAVAFGMLLMRSVEREIRQRQELLRLNAQLQEMSDMKSNFISIASHQLRAPIGGIRGYLSMLRDGDFGKLGRKVDDIIDLNLDTLNHTLHVIETFLNVTRIEAGKMDLNKEPVDLCPMTRDIYKELALTASRKKIRLVLSCPQKIAMVRADKEKIRNAVFNLIENALKYTERGTIKTTIISDSKHVVMRVADTGIGIAPEEVPQLFAKFVRAGGGLKISHGSGLGLYIVKTLIEAHGGTAFVESQGTGKGSTFGFRMPVGKMR